jgi:hypothetical protein
VAYPSLEQYQEALQNPKLALTDPLLSRGTVETTGLGMPLAMCGGFALTYSIVAAGNKYAVRCFHRQSNALETRYASISTKLRSVSAPYFVAFDFQPKGVRVNGALYPVVKMEWSAGDTLGEFLEANYRNAKNLDVLIKALAVLAGSLEQMGIAHGDIQPGNVMVNASGSTLKLIDYDGMYVPEIRSLGSSELGHRNFQHPLRSPREFDSTLDRFSMIALNVALRALIADQSLWQTTHCEADQIVFSANDYADPGNSVVFGRLFSIPAVNRDAKALAAICDVPFSKIPSLEDFLAGRNCPTFVAKARPASTRETPAPASYISQYPVLNAVEYLQFERHIGQVVELVGQIFEVSTNVTKRSRRPYVFVNFSHWKGKAVKLNIWSDVLGKMTNKPTKSWAGRWVSVKGLVDPKYSNARHGYTHISITISTASQINVITEAEARYRLGGRPTSAGGNAAIVDRIRRDVSGPKGTTAPGHSSQQTQNQAILRTMQRQGQGSSSQSLASGQGQPAQPSPARKAKSGIPGWIWIVGIVSFLFILSRCNG